MLWLWALLACPGPEGTDTEVPYTFGEGVVVLPEVILVDASGERGPFHLVLDGERIDAILETAVPIPDGVRQLETAGHWVTPGLVDPHVHLTHSATTSWVGDTLAYNLRMTLAYGVTSVVDVGAPVEAVALRDRVEAGEILGPSIKLTGPMVTEVGSHPCETWNDPDLCWFASNADEGQTHGDALVAAGTDGIKLALADADFSPWATPRLDPEVAAVAVDAVLAGNPDALVVVHVDEVEDALDAVAFGATHLAHPVFGGEALGTTEAKMLTEVRAVHSTVGAFAGVGDLLDGTLDVDALEDWLHPGVAASWTSLASQPSLLDPTWVAESADWAEAARDSLETLAAAGVTVVPASDAGYYFQPHGYGLHRELAELQALGWTNAELLTAATATAAATHGWSDRGLLEVGQRADLLVLPASPLEDLTVLQAPEQVFLGGVAHPRTSLVDAEVLLTARTGDQGDWCLEDADCGDVCDLSEHRCTTGCDTPYDITGADCGVQSWCAPADGVVTTAEGVCHVPDQSCRLTAEDPCSPTSYEELCVPADIDTSYCYPSGDQQVGEVCSYADPAWMCAPGLFCSWSTDTCFELCDPSAETDTCSSGQCRPETVAGEVWFGLCW